MGESSVARIFHELSMALLEDTVLLYPDIVEMLPHSVGWQWGPGVSSSSLSRLLPGAWRRGAPASPTRPGASVVCGQVGEASHKALFTRQFLPVAD